MFQSLLQIYYMPHYLDYDELHRRADQGVAVASDFLRFLEEVDRFPFREDLETAMAANGLDLETALEQHTYHIILDYLLTERGIGCGMLPKGLMKFHRYKTECRSAFEEHLIEGARYLSSEDGICRIHFTVAPEFASLFESLLEQVRERYENRCRTRYDITFSFQKPSTNTIAVDLNDKPFRDKHGKLHFRPGGHGALLENLNELGGDLVFIKNVDNIVPDRLKDAVTRWKCILGGCLVEAESTIHGILRDLKSGDTSSDRLDTAVSYARKNLHVAFPPDFASRPYEARRSFLFEKLNHPIRVCGVVPNAGEPGGAPFWVEAPDGTLSIQIVEKAQISFDDPAQRTAWKASTHFNPVDIVCSLRDFEGKPFDLKRYVDETAVFISKKSKDGRELKALELPGLWNGSMARWITLIVEVPRYTFNPVKTIFDLLRPEHQPED